MPAVLKTQLTALQNLVGALGHELSQKVAGPSQDLRGPVTNRNWHVTVLAVM